MGLPQGACLRRGMLPNLARIDLRHEVGVVTGSGDAKRLTGQHATLPRLPEELWIKIANAAVHNSNDPCLEVENLCGILEAPWSVKNGCGEHGWIFEEANQRFRWYGEYTNWGGVHARMVKVVPEDDPDYVDTTTWPTTPREYFATVCRELRALRNGHNTTARTIRSTNKTPYMMTLVKARLKAYPQDLKFMQPTDPLYSDMAEAALRAKPSHALQYVNPNRADYKNLARISVTTNDYTLRYVKPKTGPFFGELALIAMRQPTGGTALEAVPTDHPMYGEIAQIGVTTWGGALRWVPTDHPDYYNIAKAAMSATNPPLDHLPLDKPYYTELARIAVVKRSWNMRYVPANLPDYVALAVLAVRAHPYYALEYVHPDRMQEVRDALAAAS